MRTRVADRFFYSNEGGARPLNTDQVNQPIVLLCHLPDSCHQCHQDHYEDHICKHTGESNWKPQPRSIPLRQLRHLLPSTSRIRGCFAEVFLSSNSPWINHQHQDQQHINTVISISLNKIALSRRNPLVDCSSLAIPSLNLSAWAWILQCFNWLVEPPWFSLNCSSKLLVTQCIGIFDGIEVLLHFTLQTVMPDWNISSANQINLQSLKPSTLHKITL